MFISFSQSEPHSTEGDREIGVGKENAWRHRRVGKHKKWR